MPGAVKSKLSKEENLPGVTDELGQDSIEEAKANAQKELDHFKQNVETITKARERFENMWKRDERLYMIMIGAHKKLEPVYGYEKSDEYWDIRKEQLVEKYEEDKFLAERKIEEYGNQLIQLQEQIDSTQELLNDLNGD